MLVLYQQFNDVYCTVYLTKMLKARMTVNVNNGQALYYIPSSALTLLVGQQEGHPACKSWHWFVGGDDMSGALYVLQLQLSPLPPPTSLALFSIHLRAFP